MNEDLKVKFTNVESRLAYVTAWNKSSQAFYDRLVESLGSADLSISADDRRQLLYMVNDFMLDMHQSIYREVKNL